MHMCVHVYMRACSGWARECMCAHQMHARVRACMYACGREWVCVTGQLFRLGNITKFLSGPSVLPCVRMEYVSPKVMGTRHVHTCVSTSMCLISNKGSL